MVEAPRVFMMRIASLYRSRKDHSSYAPKGTSSPRVTVLGTTTYTAPGWTAPSEERNCVDDAIRVLGDLHLAFEIDGLVFVVRDELGHEGAPPCDHSLRQSSTSLVMRKSLGPMASNGRMR
jgi:hypothetical protein